ANAKAWVTQQIFLEWFKNNFVPEVREHFKKIGLKDDSKILLLLDNCPAHPDAKDFNAKNVIVKYFPPNCTSLIQPMDQGAIWSFKCHYRKTIVQKLVTTSDREEFKKTFNIKKALWSIDNAWNAVTSAVLKNVWNNLFCPENEDPELMETLQSNNVSQITNITYDFTTEDIETWLSCDENDSPFAVLSDEEILRMINSSDEPEQENRLEESDDDIIVSKITLKEAINAASTLLDFLESPGCSGITEQDKIQIYRIQENLVNENTKLKKKRQTTLHDYF
ncbi:jerky protein homolog-like, partial [Lucilia sericata]|uniref:jerky protein homolog-like n=1 Tax=Lucilia sericata TaxID=13632 RepID=UPI0018A83E05